MRGLASDDAAKKKLAARIADLIDLTRQRGVGYSTSICMDAQTTTTSDGNKSEISLGF